jgi:hypothetical protein
MTAPAKGASRKAKEQEYPFVAELLDVFCARIFHKIKAADNIDEAWLRNQIDQAKLEFLETVGD